MEGFWNIWKLIFCSLAAVGEWHYEGSQCCECHWKHDGYVRSSSTLITPFGVQGALQASLSVLKLQVLSLVPSYLLP